MKYTPLMLAGLVSAACFTAFAQQSSAPVAIPPHNCEKPAGGPGVQPTYEQTQRFQKKVDAYKDCINKYVSEMRKQADEHLEITKKYQDAGNAAVGEYNAYVTDLNTQLGSKDKNSSGLSAQPPTQTPSPPPRKY